MAERLKPQMCVIDREGNVTKDHGGVMTDPRTFRQQLEDDVQWWTIAVKRAEQQRRDTVLARTMLADAQRKLDTLNRRTDATS